MAQCSGKHISAMQLFYELKQGFPHIPDRLVNHCIKQAQGNKEACWCMLKSEKPRMSEPQVRRLEVSSAPSHSIERPSRPPATRTTFMPPSFNSSRLDQSLHSLIEKQLERKNNLEIELLKEKRRLTEMQKREEELRKELSARLAASNFSLKAKRLSEEITFLTTVCSKLSDEIDELGEDECRWGCHVCTFHNHHLVNQCQTCSMPHCYYPDYEECEYDSQ